MTEKASEAMHHATDSARHAVHSAREHLSDAATGTWDHLACYAKSLRRKPLALALIGGGIAWMVLGSKARNAYYRKRIDYMSQEPQKYGGSYVDARTGEAYASSGYGQEWQQQQQQPQGPGHDAGQGEHRPIERVREYGSKLGQRASEYGHAAADRGRHTAEDMRHRVEDAGHRLRERADQARESVAHGLHTASDYLHEGQNRAWHQVEAHPLTAGAAAFGLGLLVGLLVPETRYEDEYLGAYADKTRRYARRGGRDLIDRGKHVAQATVEAVTDEARKQGLTPEGLKESAQQFAERAKETVQEEMTGSAEEKKDDESQGQTGSA